MKKYDAVILGGGIAGLTAAYELSKHGKYALVVEREKDLGGAVASYHFPTFTIEAFYHHFFPRDKDLQMLLSELQLHARIVWKEVPPAFFSKGKFYRLFKPMDLLSFSAISFLAKLELCRLMLTIKMTKDPGKYDNCSVRDFIVRFGGKHVYDELFLHLLRSKYGSQADTISAAWFIERIQLRSHTGKQGEILGYLNGGFYQLVSRLQEEIRKTSTILCGSSADKIETEKGKIIRVRINKKWYDAPVVLSTIPPHILSSVIEFPEEYKHRISQHEYQPAICIMLGLKRPIGPYYWTNILEPSVFGAVVDHCNFMNQRDYGNQHIVYLGSYVDVNSPLLTMSEESVFAQYFTNLKKLFPYMQDSDVLWKRVGRIRNAGLFYKKGIKKILLPYVTPYTNLFIAGMFNSYPERSISDSVAKGKTLAKYYDIYRHRSTGL